MNERIEKIRVAITTKDLADIMYQLGVLNWQIENKDKEIKGLREKIAELSTIKEKGEK